MRCSRTRARPARRRRRRSSPRRRHDGRAIACSGDRVVVVHRAGACRCRAAARRRAAGRAARPRCGRARAGVHDGLDEVAVDGMAVHGVALRPRAHGLAHSGSHWSMMADLVQALPHGDQPGTGGQEVGEEVAGQRGPGLGRAGRAARQVVQRRGGDGQAGARGDDGGAQSAAPRRSRRDGSCRARPRRRSRTGRSRAGSSAGGVDRPAGCGPAATARRGGACRRGRRRWCGRPSETAVSRSSASVVARAAPRRRRGPRGRAGRARGR